MLARKPIEYFSCKDSVKITQTHCGKKSEIHFFIWILSFHGNTKIDSRKFVLFGCHRKVVRYFSKKLCNWHYRWKLWMASKQKRNFVLISFFKCSLCVKKCTYNRIGFLHYRCNFFLDFVAKTFLLFSPIFFPWSFFYKNPILILKIFSNENNRFFVNDSNSYATKNLVKTNWVANHITVLEFAPSYSSKKGNKWGNVLHDKTFISFLLFVLDSHQMDSSRGFELWQIYITLRCLVFWCFVLGNFLQRRNSISR